MAASYIVINCKSSTFDGADNVVILCYSKDKCKYLLCGSNTESLKMTRDDFNFVLRNRGYNLDDLPQKALSPIFGRYDRLTDFTLFDPKTGEVFTNVTASAPPGGGTNP